MNSLVELLLPYLPPVVAAILLLVAFSAWLLWRLLQSSQNLSWLELVRAENLALAEKLQQSSSSQHKLLQEQLSRDKDSLFQQLLQDRSNQLQSLADLRIELEKRFAGSGASLSQNIQQFQGQMVDRFESLQRATYQTLANGLTEQTKTVNSFGERLAQNMEAHQVNTQAAIVDNIRKGIAELRADLDRSIKQQSDTIGKNLTGLTETTDHRLKEISGQVEQRLNEGFDKTNKTFNDVLQRLALIDDAQKKITELSSNVVSLQQILNDKRSRGAFGEIQLQSLVSNLMPDSHYAMQQTLGNGKVADCVLLLPEPTGKIAIDAKFPLESYRLMMDVEAANSDRKEAARQFARDIRTHINDIADKYVYPPETTDGAVMFIPAESVFAEIHGHYPEIVEFAYQRKVWMVSPTTLMAILTTAASVIKDEQTRQQVHIIKEHLGALGKDFFRFQDRMDSLSKHIGMVSKDVEQVHTSAKKITSRFHKIERVDLVGEESAAQLEFEPSDIEESS